MSDMNEAIRSARSRRTVTTDVPEEPAPQPTFGKTGSYFLFGQPRRTTSDRLRAMFDNRARATTIRVP